MASHERAQAQGLASRGAALARARGHPVLTLQNALGNRAVQQLLRKESFSGTVYLPGDARLGHSYQLEGSDIVERSGKTKTKVGSVGADGKYMLLGPDGELDPASGGDVRDLVGSVTQRGGAHPGLLTQTKGSGQFKLTDAKGAERTLKVKDGAVFLVDGKTQQLVGHVDATGRYEVSIDGAKQAGSLDKLAPGKASGSFKRSEGAKVIQQLEIGQDSLPEGELVLPDGRYTIKGSKLYRAGAKDPAGEITVVRAGPGRRAAITAIPYQYTDATGKVFTGDAYAPTFKGEGSKLKLGKGRDWIAFAGGRWEDLRGTGKGFVMFGGGRLRDKLTTLRSAGKVTITDEEINTLQAVAEVESSGFVQCINTWDSDVLSFGFKQYTMAGKLQDLIKRAPDAFARYGIRLGGTWTIKKTSKKPAGMTVEAIAGVATPEELRGPYWAAKFYQAGLDDEIIAAEVVKAKEDLVTLTKKLSSFSGKPHFSSERVQRIVLELENNRPAYTVPSLKRAYEKATAAVTEDEFITLLCAEMEQEYVTHRERDGNGATEAKARQKAKNICGKTKKV